MNEQEIFVDLLQIVDRSERHARLQQACAGDLDLQRRVEFLLQAHDNAGQFLESPAVSLATIDLPPIAEGPGDTIGPYKLLQQIGEGGFGVVYMAEQQEPVRRKVALKIIKPGMDTRDVIARFESERQALALMDHPNIARVFDAGATASGRPFFVMELVKGLPITEFADKNKLTIEQRLPLFVDVCRAVQHAHQKGVIHRDLKPTNVMVTLHDGRPVVKVIDFGVAKATSQQLTQRTLFTAYGQMIGTPAYMSPEQAEMSGLDIDTRSDIYSLGVLLYELLTGTTPLELERLRAAGYAEMQRLIRDEEPQRPSTRFSTLGDAATAIATSRGTDIKQLGQFLRGDLDWIVMKSLEKDRNRRYETPSALASDIERFLNNDAIAARPPSTAYRLRKLVRRNAAAVAAITAVAAALLIGGIASTIFGIQATRQADRAVDAERSALRNLAEAEQTGRFLSAAREELRGTLYAAEMNLVQNAWDARQYNRASLLLERQRPETGEDDLRGWEWHYWRRRMERGRLRSLEVPELGRLIDDAPLLAAGGFTGGAPLAFTSDGERLVSIVKPPADGTRADGPKYIVFDGTTGHRLSQFALLPETDENEIPPLLSISDDGTRFVHANKTRNRWQTVVRDGRSGEILTTLEPLETYPNPRAFIRVNFAISPDGALLAQVQTAMFNDARQGLTPRLSVERTVHVYDAATGQLIATLPPQPFSHARLLWSSNGKQLLCQGVRYEGEPKPKFDHTFQLFDARSGQELWSRTEKSTGIVATNLRAWSPDGRFVVVAMPTDDGDGQFELWDAATSKTMATFSRPSLSSINDPNVAFSADSRMLAHGAENEIHVWDLPNFSNGSAEPVHFSAPALTLPNIHGPLRALKFSRDGREIRAVTGAAVTAWDAGLRDPVEQTLPDRIYYFVFSPDATRIAVQEGGEMGIWDASTGKRICAIPLGQRGFNARMTFSHDGRQLALGGMEQYLDFVNDPNQKFRPVRFQPQIWLYDAEGGRLLASIDVPEESLPLDAARSSRGMLSASMRSRPSVGEFHFRHDDSQLAIVIPSSPSREGSAKLRIWDTQTHMELPPVDLPWRTGRLLGCSSDGATWVVTSQREELEQMATVAVIDAESRSLQKTHEFPGQPIFFEPRKNRVAVFEQRDLVFYDLATGREQVRLQGFVNGPRAVSPDGRRLAQGVVRAGAIEGQIDVWSLQSGRRLVTLDGPPYLRALAFSVDGHRLLTRSERWPGSQPSQIWDGTPLLEGE